MTSVVCRRQPQLVHRDAEHLGEPTLKEAPRNVLTRLPGFVCAEPGADLGGRPGLSPFGGVVGIGLALDPKVAYPRHGGSVTARDPVRIRIDNATICPHNRDKKARAALARRTGPVISAPRSRRHLIVIDDTPGTAPSTRSETVNALLDQVARLLITEPFLAEEELRRVVTHAATAASLIRMTRWCANCGDYPVEAGPLCGVCLERHDDQAEDDARVTAESDRFDAGMWR